VAGIYITIFLQNINYLSFSVTLIETKTTESIWIMEAIAKYVHLFGAQQKF
jgi:hypothetical protein